MNKAEVNYLETVWKKIKQFDYESDDWTQIDENMYLLQWLSDTELFREADVLLETHMSGNPNCGVDHSKDDCFAPKIVSVVQDIIRIYNDVGILTDQHRYILQFYLSLSQDGQIKS